MQMVGGIATAAMVISQINGSSLTAINISLMQMAIW